MQKRAIQFMIISALAFALLNIFVKNLNHFSIYQIVFFRSIGTLFFTIPLLIRKNISLLGNKKLLLILRGVIGVISMGLFFKSLKYLPMGSAVSIRYISPIFGAIFAYIILKEKIKRRQWLYFGIAFTGVVLLKGFNPDMNNEGLFYAIASAVFTGLVFIIIRKIKDDDDPLVIVNYFMIIASIAGGVLSINNWINPVGIEWLLLLSLGFFGFFGQFYMTKALQSSEINQVAPLKYIEVAFTMIIGVIWLDEIYTLWSLFGILLIIIGLTLNITTKVKKK